MTPTTTVLVVGGGYSGVLAANRLTQRDDVSVTLINPREVFVERIRLHQLAAGTHEAVVDYRDVLAGDVRLVVDTATGIDVPGHAVTLAKGDPVAYDHLVYAVGSHGPDARVPGAAELAHCPVTLEGAARLRATLEEEPPTAAVTVVGAGSTGLEVAAELAEQGRNVTLACGGPLGPYLHPRGRAAVRRRLEDLGVVVVDGPGSVVTEVTRDAMVLDGGRVLPSDVTVWTAGFGVPDLARRSDLEVDEAGRLLTDESLTSIDDPRIVATGDAAAPSGVPLRMCCASATQLGVIAADTVLARVAGEEPAELSVGFAGQCIGLGRRDGVLQAARRDDTAVGFHLAGRPVGAFKEAVARAITRQLAAEARRPGAFSLPGWFDDPSREGRVLSRTAARV